MRKIVLKGYSKNLTALALIWAMLAMPLMIFAQTRVSMPKNRYSVQDDIRLGQQAAAEVERQMPILNDSLVANYVQDVGRRLVSAIPSQYHHPGFQYSFRVVNARDINAFALPGGPMYVNRGMIEAARTEGEMAGVMAHEIAHIALRHGTAQATRQGSWGSQLGTIGMILGGAILGGQTGAQIGAMGAQAWQTKYSREYETTADILGAQIMARAGYDPRELANMFRTIEQQSGGARAPEWLSSHPNPGNRYATIEREAQLLRVERNVGQTSNDFLRVQERLRGYPRAQTMEEIARTGASNQGGVMTQGRYESRVEFPSSRVRSYNMGVASVNMPDNWEVVGQSNDQIWFAPRGAFGNSGITHGALVGITQGSGRNLQQDTQNYINGVLQANNYLRAQTNYRRTTVGGRTGLGIVLAGPSPITNRNEVVTVYTTYLRDGRVFYVVTVTPENEASTYNRAFSNVLRSVRLSG
jgi:beta-barrel assembly-enhancing protease